MLARIQYLHLRDAKCAKESLQSLDMQLKEHGERLPSVGASRTGATTERIRSDIQMIFWLITAEPPVNAVRLSHDADMAYVIIKVRNCVAHRTGKTPLGTLDAVRDELLTVPGRMLGRGRGGCASESGTRLRRRGPSMARQGGGLLKVGQGDHHLDPAVFRDSFWTLWERLCGGETVPVEGVDGTGRALSLKAAPLSGIVVDAFGSEIMALLHEQRTGAAPPLEGLRYYVWSPVSASYTAVRYWMNSLAAVEAMMEREGVSLEEAALAVRVFLGSGSRSPLVSSVADGGWDGAGGQGSLNARQVLPKKTGRLIECPACPPLYDYELEPQGYAWEPGLLVRVWAVGARAMRYADGSISLDARDYHPAATALMSEMMGRVGKKAYFAGPLVVARPDGQALREGGESAALGRWMDGQVERRGPRSVIYVSFGTLFWPRDAEKLAAAVEELLEVGVPFIMARSSPVVKLPEELVRRMEESGEVWLGEWLPQQEILGHPATGWCLTHAGHNTVLECIEAGVPIIMWPITVDQPVNAAYLSEDLRIGFELMEVRAGTGAGPVRRLGDKKLEGTAEAVRGELRQVLARAFGEEGEEMRKRMEGVRRALADVGRAGAFGREVDRYGRNADGRGGGVRGGGGIVVGRDVCVAGGEAAGGPSAAVHCGRQRVCMSGFYLALVWVPAGEPQVAPRYLPPGSPPYRHALPSPSGL
ncbi:hypothetical protein BN946_scf184512.g1 [Trametes cinnabarina]|uniref:Glycosyltransferase Family 1 protein n=1 Tax=Pycnoporus cinnabarinus TaxID=5643 RepID=A0A060SSA9_PYCCI|nr:hypothetical protein BN946_scf184512.g1 [Trametes cinnabarina]